MKNRKVEYDGRDEMREAKKDFNRILRESFSLLEKPISEFQFEIDDDDDELPKKDSSKKNSRKETDSSDRKNRKFGCDIGEELRKATKEGNRMLRKTYSLLGKPVSGFFEDDEDD